MDEEIEKYEEFIDEVEKSNKSLTKQQELMENAADAVVDYYDSLIDTENDTIKGIEDQIDGYDALISVSDRLYESEQQALEAQKDAIQDKIDALNDENDALDLQIRKEQALDEFYKSRNQRTKHLYAGEGKGMIYTQDTDAIREKQQNLQDIETEILVDSLEKEQKALDESIDALQKYRDAINDIADAHKRFEEESIVSNLLGSDYASIILGTNLSDWDKLKGVYISSNEEIKNHEDTIARLEEAKDQWTDLSNVIDTQVKEQAASEQFGADWKKQIQEGTLISFEEYKEMYLDIQSQINDNNSTIESIEEKIAYYETLKENYSSITTVYEEEEANRYAAMLMGQGWENDVLDGRLETLNNFRDNYVSLQEEIANAAWESANAQIEAYKKVQDETGGDEPPENVKVHVKEELISSKNVIFQKYAKGTDHAKKGLNLVGEEGVETYIDNNGNVSLVTEPTLIPMEGGETVKNASETKSMLNPDNLVSLKSILSGEVPTVLKRESDVLLTKAPWTNMEKMLTPIDYSHMFKNLNTSLPQNVVQKRDTVVNQNININCPNVTNNSGAEYLQRELQKAQLMAYQRSYRN